MFKCPLTQVGSRSSSPADGGPRLYPDGNHMPVLFPNATVFLSVRYPGRLDKAHTAWNQRSLCQEEPGRNALLLSPEMSFEDFGRCSFHKKLFLTLGTFISTFTDTLNKDLCFGNASVYCMKSDRLHLHGFEFPSCFSTCAQFSGLITGLWGMACRGIQQTLWWYSFLWQIEGCVNLSSATEGISSCVREQLSQEWALILDIYLKDLTVDCAPQAEKWWINDPDWFVWCCATLRITWHFKMPLL